MTQVEFLRDFCKKRKIAISKLESDLGYSNGYFNPKKLKKIPIDKAVEIAEYLRLDVFELLDEEDTQKLIAAGKAGWFPGIDAKPTRVPVLGRVAAGIPIHAIEEVIEWEELPAYALKGDRDRTGLSHFYRPSAFMRVPRKSSVYAGFKRFIFETLF